MDKVYGSKNTEEKIYQEWEKKGYFKANPDSSKKPYSLLMPPPNVNGELHLGHAMEHSIMDALSRFKRLKGYDVLLLPGVDHAGILFEGTFNKILEKQGLSKQKLGREEWLKRAWQFKEEVYNSFHKTWTLMGISADWPREVFTLEPKVQKAVLEEFKTFWEQDLLYKGTYIVQWCPKCGTAIEDLEMEYHERKEKLFYVRYKITGTNDYITIATARPETIFADVGIAIYPNHPKYRHFIGKKAINPLTGSKLPIFEDKRVNKEFGTGALKITPGHDLLDYEIGKDHNLSALHAIDKQGRMTDLAGDFVGQKAEEAREKTFNILFDKGLAGKAEQHVHTVPVCERCKTVVEPLISEEWFVKMKPLAEKALKHLHKINFLPKNYRKILSDWYKQIHDWAISRSLWWGHRIPVWYCQKCNSQRLVGEDKGMLISFEKPGSPCPICKGQNWIQDEQVLDAWFSSGLWPMATLGWPDETKELKKYYPWDFETSAPEIKYLWIARMIMLGLWFKDKIPFKNQFFHGMLRDLQGRKFSKSLGNGISPYDLVATWGVDATRMALYTYSAAGRDSRTSRQIMDQRSKNFRNFGTKIRNITKFVIDLAPKDSKNQLKIENSEDKKIIESFNKMVKEVTENIENFQLHLATEQIVNFIWHEFADIYIEKSKSRRAEAQPVLEYLLTNSLILLHPFMPFTTEELYKKIPGCKESIMLEKWSEAVIS